METNNSNTYTLLCRTTNVGSKKTTQNCSPLTNHDGGEALRGVVGTLGPAVLGLTGQREVCQVLQEWRQ